MSIALLSATVSRSIILSPGSTGVILSKVLGFTLPYPLLREGGKGWVSVPTSYLTASEVMPTQ